MSSKSAGSELLSMMALVAAVVAAVILVFFGSATSSGACFSDRVPGRQRRSRLAASPLPGASRHAY